MLLTTKDLQALSQDIPDIYVAVLQHISDGNDPVESMSHLALLTGYTERSIQICLKEMKSYRLVNFGPLFSFDDATLTGSGYWRNQNGDNLLKHLGLRPHGPQN